jgi:hypothetical protein
MKTKLASLLYVLIGFSSLEQVNNTRILDRNNVSCIIGDEGYFFNNSSTAVAAYNIPKNTELNTIFHTSVWFAALDIYDQLHVSSCAHPGYGVGTDIHSGPISSNNMYNNLSYSNQYTESIWKISKQEILNHMSSYSNSNYVVPTSIATWPGNGNTSLGVVQNLAPYADVNSNGTYDPANGDYPIIRGDEAVYVIMNDKSYNPDPNTLGIEIHMMVYQFTTGNYLNNTTFVNLQVFNRSNKNYKDFRQTLYIDFDIGNYSDDFVGCYPPNHVVFGYNGDNNDQPDGGRPGYGLNPPCQGVAILSHELFSAGYFTSTSQYPYADGTTDLETWNLMNARWNDGSNWLYGGLGYQGSPGVFNQVTNFLFDGNPNDPTAWHEVSNNNPSGDRRSIMTIAEPYFPAGSKICSDYAFIYDKSSSHLDNVQNVINIAASLRTLYNSSTFFPCNSSIFNHIESNELPQLTIYPIPFNEYIFIENAIGTELEITDSQGSVVRKIRTESNLEKIDLSELSHGVYFIRSVDPTLYKAFRLVK